MGIHIKKCIKKNNKKIPNFQKIQKLKKKNFK